MRPSKILSSILVLGGWLTISCSAVTYTCPKASKDPVLVPYGNKITVKKSGRNTLCMLVHLEPKDPQATPITSVSKTSRSADFTLTPIARSYYGKKWNNVAGPFQKQIRVKKCQGNKCTIRGVNTIEPYTSASSPNGSFVLISTRGKLSFREELSRFFSQSTFGPTLSMINDWSNTYTENEAGMTQYIRDQIDLPPTTLREEFRKNADFSLVGAWVGTAAVTPKHPCAQYSRWRDFALSGDDYGKNMKVESFGGKLLLSVNGEPRTLMDTFTTSNDDLFGAGDYQLGYRAGGEVGGAILLRGMNGNTPSTGYVFLDGGNPQVVLTSAAIATDSDLIAISLPDRSSFEELRPVIAPALFDNKAGGTIRMNVANSGSGCDSVSSSSVYTKVVGQFPDGTYAWYDGYAELENNTPDAPISDGGAEKVNLGVEYCANVPKHFFNAETCTVSTEVACAGQPHRYWSDQQALLANTVVCGSPNEVANSPDAPVAATNAYQFQGVSESMFYGGFDVQKQAVWYKVKIQAQDQFRQRASWALAQLLVVTLNQIDNGSIWTEMFLNYEDIFTRHAFGNYRDVLREVSYSPMMGEMLSFLDSTSALYALQREGRVSRPDENYAREIMQLFSLGLYRLNMDGTYKRKNGELIQTYDNSDIQTFARVWTGFKRNGPRSNYDGYRWNPNKIDPMLLDGEKRDPFPKLNLENGYIGDGYPLCADLPSNHFLRKGATYRAVGNFNQPELSVETNWWKDHEATRRTVLDSSSELYQVLCNADGGSQCNYQTVVRLEQDLTCTGEECLVDTLQLIKIEESPDLYYEYMPFPCIELAFSNNSKKVLDQYSKAMCADAEVKEYVASACSPAVPPASNYWTGKAWSYCKYTGEKLSYATNLARCESYGGTVIDPELLNPSGWNSTCGLGIPGSLPGWRWTSQSCTTSVKVESSGMVSIVHNPNLDINSVLGTAQSIYQPVSPENKNFFKIKWDNDAYPEQCGDCQQLSDGCLCEVVITEEGIFTEVPTAEEALSLESSLKIGCPHPDWLEMGYALSSETNGISVYLLPSDGSNINERAIFGVEDGDETKFFRNKNSFVQISNGAQTYKFRNPPSLMSILEQRTIDAYYETEAILDYYTYHDNTAPFIARRMIQRLVTSNPSPQYVRKAATAFRTGKFTKHGIEFGKGVEGDLEALFAAILLHTEARSTVLDTDPSHGSLREPLLKLFGFLRSMEFTQNTLVPTFRMVDMITKIGQEPFKSPSVFSFFSPDYAEQGGVLDASLTSPESQILNAPTIVGFLNGLMSIIDTGLNNCYGGFGLIRTVSNCRSTQNYDATRYARGTLGYIPGNETASAVVDELALLLNGGRLSKSSRTAIENSYIQILTGGGSNNKALRMAQKLMLMTPEFHATNTFKSIPESRPDPVRPDPPTKPYKALIYVNLNGGLDSYNVLVPHDDCIGNKDMFAEYDSVRSTLAVTKSSLHTISASGQICNKFGIHEKLPGVHSLYDSGELSFLSNVGVLQQSVLDKERYRELNKKTALFAHNTQQEEINSVDIFDETAGIGVCGRIADVLSLGGYTAGTVSVAGSAPALTSKESNLLVVNPAGYEKLNPISWETVDEAAIKEINKATKVGSSLFSEVWSEKIVQAMSENDILFQEMSSVILSTEAKWENNNRYLQHSLGRQMKSIAELIKTKEARRTDRDIFYAEVAGFDTHGLQDIDLNNRLKEIDDSLTVFVEEMKAQNVWDDVAIVYVSEFGRTLVANSGNGSDHAWGGNYFLASGSLKGGQIMGEYPHDLTADGPQVISEVGIVIPTTPWESLWNGIAEWFGVTSENDLKTILPNRAEFENILWGAADLFN